jgi:hypothetical protein
VPKISRTIVAASLGVATGAVTDQALKGGHRRLTWSALLLVGAGAAYPLSDLGSRDIHGRRRELGGVAATLGVSLVTAMAPPRAARRFLAGAWLSHTVFDAVHHRSETSRLPAWYPTFCAAYDIAMAASLRRS